MFSHQSVEMIRQKRGSRGFTLIEVLISMAIFSIGILAVGAMQINSTNSNTAARIQTEETTLVVDQIEQLTALDYDDADLDASDHSLDQSPYTVSWTVAEDEPVVGAKMVTVTVTSAHHRGRPISISFIKGG
jgi:prepilin-type N-terminal cleavage/methylation domain-containing protein